MPGGRPEIITGETLHVLEGAFSNGATDIQACFLAKIGTSTLYNYQERHPEFLERKRALKDMILYQAKIKVMEAVEKEERPDTAKWLLERRDKDFKTKSDITSDDKEIKSITGINYIIPDGNKFESDNQTAPSLPSLE